MGRLRKGQRLEGKEYAQEGHRQTAFFHGFHPLFLFFFLFLPWSRVRDLGLGLGVAPSEHGRAPIAYRPTNTAPMTISPMITAHIKVSAMGPNSLSGKAPGGAPPSRPSTRERLSRYCGGISLRKCSCPLRVSYMGLTSSALYSSFERFFPSLVFPPPSGSKIKEPPEAAASGGA